ncbi:MAG: hypothetical protein FWG62_04125 [Proteobacteria bacterium]|nr:hypothetical protein [Pseudomonadota bacterium]
MKRLCGGARRNIAPLDQLDFSILPQCGDIAPADCMTMARILDRQVGNQAAAIRKKTFWQDSASFFGLDTVSLGGLLESFPDFFDFNCPIGHHLTWTAIHLSP